MKEILDSYTCLVLEVSYLNAGVNADADASAIALGDEGPTEQKMFQQLIFKNLYTVTYRLIIAL